MISTQTAVERPFVPVQRHRRPGVWAGFVRLISRNSASEKVPQSKHASNSFLSSFQQGALDIAIMRARMTPDSTYMADRARQMQASARGAEPGVMATVRPGVIGRASVEAATAKALLASAFAGASDGTIGNDLEAAAHRAYADYLREDQE